MIEVTAQYKNLQIGLQIPEQDLIILVGPNNSGKSNILRYLDKESIIKDQIDYISPSRLNVENSITVSPNHISEMNQDFQSRKNNFNDDSSEMAAPNPTRELFKLSDTDRDRVIEWHNKYFGKIEIVPNDTTNKWSGPKITIDGKKINLQGSGSRAILTILVKLLDPGLQKIAIDEPEIAVEPQIQKKLFQLFKKVSQGSDGLPKKQIYIATHSHLFLDRENIQNNYELSIGANSNVIITQVTTETQLHSIVFSMLGNSPNDLFFPRNIIVVEGPSDQIYLRKILELLKFETPLAVHFADGEGQIKYAIPGINSMLKTVSYLPLYKQKICILADAKVDKKTSQEWSKYLETNTKERILILPKSGIEYYYPKRVLVDITGLEPSKLDENISDYLEQMKSQRKALLGKFEGSKRELANEVAARLVQDDLKEVDKEILNLCKTANKLGAW